MSITLRPYQESAVAAVVAGRWKAPILVAPTGSGKTVMGVEIAKRIGGGVLWVAHRRELLKQARGAIAAAGSEWICVRSVQEMAYRPERRAEVLIIDECHHATAPTYQRLIENHPIRIGLTATPFRLDGAGLRGAGFRSMVVAATVAGLCRDGYLVEPEVYTAKPPALDGVRVRHGDYRNDELQARVDTPALVADVVSTWERRAAGRRTVCFAVSVAHAEHLAARWRDRGHSAEVVSGRTPKAQRDETLDRLAAGAIDVIVNCQILTEGWDLPALEVASIARPTASLNLYLQMVGRLMRAAGDKKAVVLDHAGNHIRHGPVTQDIAYSLTGKVRTTYDRASAERASIDDADTEPKIPAEAEGELSLVVSTPPTTIDPHPTPLVRRSTTDPGTGTCPECGKQFVGTVPYYCGSCRWKRERALGMGNCRKAEFDCPTCGKKFQRSFQVAKRAKSGKVIYCSFYCNPNHPAYRVRRSRKAKVSA